MPTSSASLSPLRRPASNRDSTSQTSSPLSATGLIESSTNSSPTTGEIEPSNSVRKIEQEWPCIPSAFSFSSGHPSRCPRREAYLRTITNVVRIDDVAQHPDQPRAVRLLAGDYIVSLDLAGMRLLSSERSPWLARPERTIEALVASVLGPITRAIEAPASAPIGRFAVQRAGRETRCPSCAPDGRRSWRRGHRFAVFSPYRSREQLEPTQDSPVESCVASPREFS